MILVLLVLGTATAGILDREYLPPKTNFSHSILDENKHPYYENNIKHPKLEKDTIINPTGTFDKFENSLLNNTISYPEMYPTSTNVSALKDYPTCHSFDSNCLETYLYSSPNSNNISTVYNNDKDTDRIFVSISHSTTTMSSLPDFIDNNLHEQDARGEMISKPFQVSSNNISLKKSSPRTIQSEVERNAVIINYENIINPDSYAYNYDTSNNIYVDEKGSTSNGVNAKGSYSYLGDNGKLYNVTYTADENGFQPHGDHLPTSPPIPDAILKVIEQAYRDKQAGIFDDGSYDSSKYGHKKYQNTVNEVQRNMSEKKISSENNPYFNHNSVILTNDNNGNNTSTNKEEKHYVKFHKLKSIYNYKDFNFNENQDPDNEYRLNDVKNNSIFEYQHQEHKKDIFNNTNFLFQDNEQKYTGIISEEEKNKRLLNDKTGYQYYKPQNITSRLLFSKYIQSDNQRSENLENMKTVTPIPFLTSHVTYEDGDTEDYYNENDIDILLNDYENVNDHHKYFDGINGDAFYNISEVSNNLSRINNDDHNHNKNDFNSVKDMEDYLSVTNSSLKLPTIFTSRHDIESHNLFGNKILSAYTALRTADLNEFERNATPNDKVLDKGYSDNIVLNKKSTKLVKSTLIPKIGTTFSQYLDIIRDESNRDVEDKNNIEKIRVVQTQRFDPASRYYY